MSALLPQPGGFEGSIARASQGPAWSTEMRASAGFVARHPDGY
jgi:hypothetical protein